MNFGIKVARSDYTLCWCAFTRPSNLVNLYSSSRGLEVKLLRRMVTAWRQTKNTIVLKQTFDKYHERFHSIISNFCNVHKFYLESDKVWVRNLLIVNENNTKVLYRIYATKMLIRAHARKTILYWDSASRRQICTNPNFVKLEYNKLL